MYKPQARDTSIQMDKKMFELLRAAGPARRLELACGFTAACIGRHRRQMAKQHPEWDEREVALQWAAMAYGQELAMQVRSDMAERRNTVPDV